MTREVFDLDKEVFEKWLATQDARARYGENHHDTAITLFLKELYRTNVYYLDGNIRFATIDYDYYAPYWLMRLMRYVEQYETTSPFDLLLQLDIK